MKQYDLNRGEDRRSWQLGDTMLIAALILLVLNFWLPTLSLLVACLLAGFLVWKADLRFFPALIVLHFSARNFLIEDFGTEDYYVETLEFSYLLLGRLPITVNNTVAVVMTLRWVYALLAERKPVLKKHLRLVILWTLALPVAVLITFVAFEKSLISPTQTFKGLLGFGVFFYGMLLSEGWQRYRLYVVVRLLFLIGSVCLLGLLGLCGTNFFFFCLAAGPALAFACLRSQSLGSGKVVAIYALLMSLLYGIIGQPGSDQFQSTLTSMGQAMLSLIIGVLVVRRQSFTLFFRSYGLAVIISVLFTAYAINMAGNIDPNKVTEEATLGERIQFKLYGDRSPLWKRTWDKICQPPYIIREYRPYIDDRGKDQKYGAHNTYLQILDVQGWWSGLIFIAMILALMTIAQKVARKSPDVLLKGIYGGLYVICTIGVTTGHSAGAGDYLFIWGTLAGVIIGIQFYQVQNALVQDRFNRGQLR